MPVRLIASDIDGTLLNKSRVIPRENAEAILRAQKKGVVTAIATGRFPENAYLLLEDYGLRCPIIGINGGHIVDEKLRDIQTRFMLPGTGEMVQRTLEEEGADYFIFAPRTVCASGTEMRHHSEIDYGDRIRALGLSYYHGADEARAVVRESVFKFFVLNTIPLVPLREKLKGIRGIQLTQSAPSNIEIMPLGVDKGQGVRDFARSMGIPLEETMTLGDEENDIPMLTAAGYGVAMGNGSRLAKAAARYLTDTNENCGFAKAVEVYALQEE